jgi:hypothetical protein
MKVTMLLADAAQQVGGKLYILGGGWSITGPAPVPTAIAIKIEIPWDEANRQHQLLIQLVDADGQPVQVGGNPIQIHGQFEAGRPAGLAPGTPLDAALAINLSPLPLPPGRRYVWRLSINGDTHEDWQTAFTVRAGPAPPPAPPR